MMMNITNIVCPLCKQKAIIVNYGSIVVEDQHVYDNRKIFAECPKCRKSTKHYPVDFYSEPNGYDKLITKIQKEFENGDCAG